MSPDAPETPRAVIFDMDGVLIDSYEAHYDSWRRMLADHGRTLSEDQFRETFGQTNKAIISALWSDAADEATVRRWGDQKEEHFREILRERCPVMPGVPELLSRLHDGGFALAVGSSGPDENVRTVLECLPGGQLFDARVTGCDVTHSKPHPEVFLTAAEKLGVAPGRCVVVEDAPAGVEAAKRAGMAAIALTGTAEAEALEARGADRVVRTLAELTAGEGVRLID